MSDTRKSIGIQREKMVATFREVSGEAAPMSALFCTKCGRVADTAKHAGCDYLAVRVSWPQTDTLTQIEEAEKRGEIAPIRRYVPSPDDSTQAVPATAPTPHSDSDALNDLVYAYGVASFDYGQAKMEGRSVERCRNERAIRRTALDNAIAALRSENARMAEVLEAARLNVCTVPETCRNPLCAAFRKYDDFNRRASRTQSPDANPETKQ